MAHVAELNKEVLVEVTKLKKEFPVARNFWGKPIKTVKAVNDVSFDIKAGECLSLVGESGCGKSTTARLVLKLIKADAGEVKFEGRDIYKFKATELRKIRTDMQMIFQNPYSSLDPKFTHFDSIAEPLRVHAWKDKQKIKKRVYELLDLVELDASLAEKYPHQCSGGQNQRIGIARALALNPKFIIADEAVSALDVSVQAKVLELIKKLQKELGISFLFISHNLGVVKYVSDRVAVMYLGEIVEIASKDELFSNPLHPYTQALLSAAPIADPKQKNRERIFLEGDIPSPSDIPSGCPFHTRCHKAKPECSEIKPSLKIQNDSGHQVSCILYD